MLSPKKALLEAARLIEVHGHQKGNYGRPDIGFCLSGAIWWAITKHPRRNMEGNGDENLLYAEAVQLVFDDVAQPVGVWNDNPARTKTEVVDMLRRVGA